jgi:hypothetical protein
MIRNSIMAAACAFAALAVPAAAQEVDRGEQRLEIIGTAPSACILRAPVGAAGVNATFEAQTANSGAIRILALVNPTTAQPQAASIALQFPVICNSAHRLIARSGNGGLLRERGNARNRQSNTGFAEFLAYQVGMSWNGSTVTQASDAAGALQLNSANGAAGEVALTVTVPAGGGPLIAGRYADVLVIEFQAAN